MTTIIMRSALESWGHQPPPELHSIVSDYRGRRVVTWAEVMQARRERQAWVLEQLRAFDPWRAFKLWVAYFDQRFYAGWHAFLENRDGQAWVDRDRPSLIPQLMDLYPLVLPLGDRDEAWERWKVAFARQFRRRTHDRRPMGVAYLWWNGRELRKAVRFTNPIEKRAPLDTPCGVKRKAVRP